MREGTGGRYLVASEEFLHLTHDNKFFKVTCAVLLHRHHVTISWCFSHRADLQHSTTWREKGKGVSPTGKAWTPPATLSCVGIGKKGAKRLLEKEL